MAFKIQCLFYGMKNDVLRKCGFNVPKGAMDSKFAINHFLKG